MPSGKNIIADCKIASNHCKQIETEESRKEYLF